jgi:hypothetical protein
MTPPLYKNRASTLADTRTLSYPFPLYTNDSFMLWQALSGMRFKLIGAYIQNPNASGTESQLPPLLSPISVEEWLSYEQSGSSSPWPAASSVSAVSLRTYLKKYDIGMIIVDPNSVNAKIITKVFRNTIGPQDTEGGQYVWSNVQSRL